MASCRERVASCADKNRLSHPLRERLPTRKAK